MADRDDDGNLRRRLSVPIGVAALLGTGFLVWSLIGGLSHQTVSKATQVSVVQLLPPPSPPPPPPAPKVQATPPPEMIEQKRVIEPEAKPHEERPKDEPPKAHNAASPGPLGLNAKGEGPGDAFGLVGHPGGNGLFGDGGGGGSRWGWYASEVQSTIEAALRNNPKTRNANVRLQVRIWPNNAGRITRAQLIGSTGDAALDATLQNEILAGLQLQEPPPQGMPNPIVLRVTARRPG